MYFFLISLVAFVELANCFLNTNGTNLPVIIRRIDMHSATEPTSDDDGNQTLFAKQEKQGGISGASDNPGQNSGCATPEGRAGTCTFQFGCNIPQPEVYKCDSSFVPLICCPPDDRPGKLPADYAGSCQRAEVQPIVGGHEAQVNAWPWAVAIFQRSSRDPNSAQFICGGSILNKRFVITAAHCVVRYEGKLGPKDFVVLVGAHDIRTSGTFIEVTKVLAHENYRSFRRYNDITLFKLAQDLDFTNPALRPVCMPRPEMDEPTYVGETTTVIGWGTTTFQGDVSPVLQEVDVPIVSNEECNDAYKSIEGSAVSYPQGIIHSMLCAGAKEGGKDSCQGDSGGPLLYQEGKNFYQFGIVSFGYKCAEPNYPGVYTRVSSFLKWIGSHVEDNWDN